MVITVGGVLTACGLFTAVFGVVFVLVKWVVMPNLREYLRDHLIQPVAEIKEQVTNEHETNLRDDLDALRVAIALSDRRNARAWAEHRVYSDKMTQRLERVETELKALKP